MGPMKTQDGNQSTLIKENFTFHYVRCNKKYETIETANKNETDIEVQICNIYLASTWNMFDVIAFR